MCVYQYLWGSTVREERGSIFTVWQSLWRLTIRAWCPESVCQLALLTLLPLFDSIDLYVSLKYHLMWLPLT